MDFFTNYLESRIHDTLFSEGYGTARAFRDGQAKEIIDLYNILRSI